MPVWNASVLKDAGGCDNLSGRWSHTKSGMLYYQVYFALASTVRSLPNAQTEYDWQPLM